MVSKYRVFVLIAILTTSSLLTSLPISLAQTRPTVPTFTIVEISSPYDVPPTYTTNPYTGETVLSSQGYHVENKTTYLKVKNQHVTQPNNGSTLYLYYQYRYKGSYSNNAWHLVPYAPEDYIKQTDSEHTLIPFSAPSGQIDVQVRALIGFVTYIPNYMAPGGFAYYEFNGVEGDWSNTQTLTFDPSPSSPVLPSPPSNLDPSTSNQFDSEDTALLGFRLAEVILMVLLGVIVVLLVIVVVYLRRKNVAQFKNGASTPLEVYAITALNGLLVHLTLKMSYTTTSNIQIQGDYL